MIENQPCETCQYARVGIALAANQTAVNCVIEAYRNHLLRDHNFTQAEAMGTSELARELAPKLGPAYQWKAEER